MIAANLVLFAIMLCLPKCRQYTIDDEPFAILQPSAGANSEKSYFGYSIAPITSSDMSTLRVLIGAPLERKIYDCSVSACQEIPLVSTDKISAFSVTEVDGSESWMGSSIEQVRNRSVVFCLPRLKHKFDLSQPNVQSIRLNEEDMPGVCHLMSMDDMSTKLIKSPGLFDWNLQNFNKEGFGLFGFSVAVSKNQDNLIVGVPGSYYFRGQIYSIPLGKSDEIVLRKKKWLRVPERESEDFQDDWCYRGYSVGNIQLTSKQLDGTMASVPRLNNYTGAVEIYNSSLALIHTIHGHQIGAYFGYSINSADLNGDGLNDIIVGSPFFSNGDTYDCGRVDVYHQTSFGGFVHSGKIVGKFKNGRFGSKIEAIGDANEDGFQDIAVSQPYGENPSIQIYFGSPNGLTLKAKQELKSNSSMYGLSIRSIKHNDQLQALLVSSIKSGKVLLYRPKSILSVEKGVIFTPNHINSNTLQFNITICMRYRGQRLPSPIQLLTSAEIDVNSKLSPRLIFESGEKNEERMIELHHGELYCFMIRARKSKEGLRDKLSPVKFVFNYTIAEGMRGIVLNQSQTNKLEFEIPIEKSCGVDGVCIPDLSIKLHQSNRSGKYRYSPKQPVNLTIRVMNKGEDAFDAKCHVRLPRQTQLSRINTSFDESVWCEFSKNPNFTVLVCDLGNPMRSNETRAIWIQIQPDPNEKLIVLANVSSKNSEPNEKMDDNTDTIEIPLRVEARVDVVGHTEYDQIFSHNSLLNNTAIYSDDVKKLDDIGSVVSHVYKAKNVGAIAIARMLVTVKWPSHTSDGQHNLLYLSEPPELSRPEAENSTRDFCAVKSAFSTAAVNPLSISSKSRRDTGEALARGFYSTTKGKFHTFIECEVFDLRPMENVLLNIRSRLWERTIPSLSSPVVSIKSECEVKVISGRNFTSRTNVETVVYTESRAILTAIPDLWVIATAVGIGLLSLTMLVITLYCCGFFQRGHYKRYQVMTIKDDEDTTNRYKSLMMSNSENGCVAKAYERQGMGSDGSKQMSSVSANSTIL